MVDNMERAEGHTLEVVKDILVVRSHQSPGSAARPLPAPTGCCNPKVRRH
jgi:hypothetical protein